MLLSHVGQESASGEALDVCLEATEGLWAAVRTHWIEHALSVHYFPQTISGRE
jgi:hypothetical protein